MNFVGTLNLGNNVDVTDPCYKKGTWCRITTECVPGTYYGYIETSNKSVWGMRVKRVKNIAIFKDNNMLPLDEMDTIGTISVDSGLAGFFNNKKDFSEEEWEKLCKTIEKGDAWALYDGIFSNSGYGDGVYAVCTSHDGTAFAIIFIDE